MTAASLASKPLAGRVALVTGAGRGLGRALATAFAADGAALVLAARDRAQVAAVAAELTHAGARALGVACDVRDALQVRTLVETAVRECGGIDILVNNAGTFQIGAIADTDEATWDAMLDTNLKGAYLVTHAALPHVVARRGHVINMVSMAGRAAYRLNGAYCASKWGLLGFTNVLREEMRGSGVRVTAVLPGATDTSIWDGVPGDWDRSRMMRPEAVARCIVDFCHLPPEASLDELVLSPTAGKL
jgi:NAD(P)-dependent dehydrogenase (short-subunit alcohol dehydrogenase family)